MRSVGALSCSWRIGNVEAQGIHDEANIPEIQEAVHELTIPTVVIHLLRPLTPYWPPSPSFPSSFSPFLAS